MPESAPGSVTIVALFALAALAVIVLIGGLLRHIWAKHEQRTIKKNWQERERLLDSQRPVVPSHEIFEWSPRPSGTRDVAQAEPVARVLYIVARDQPELFAFLREDFAAEEAEEVIEILMDRRQGAQPCEADRRDPRRKEGASVDLREMGFVFVRQQAISFSVPPVEDRLPHVRSDSLPATIGAGAPPHPRGLPSPPGDPLGAAARRGALHVQLLSGVVFKLILNRPP
jgi:hypothetical protein